MIATARQTWPIVVLGAGPAGAMTALSLARRGAEVLLVDKATFPRDTACGCCLNARALAALDAEGLLAPRGSLRPVPTRRLRLHTSRRGLTIPLHAGAAVSRRGLDAALVEAAVQAGAALLTSVTARLGAAERGRRAIALRDSAGRTTVLRADVVVVADGRGGRSARDVRELAWRIDATAPIGVCATLPPGAAAVERGEIVMACGRHGYVGLVELEDRTVRVAAAVDPSWMRRAGGAGGAISALLREARLDARGPSAVLGTGPSAVLGTGRLGGRRRGVAAEGVFAVGDAAGDVEPFTGEGIGRALGAAQTLAPIVLDALGGWGVEHARAWTAAHRRGAARRSAWDRLVSLAVRHPRLLRPVAAALACRPSLTEPLVAGLHRGRAAEPAS